MAAFLAGLAVPEALHAYAELLKITALEGSVSCRHDCTSRSRPQTCRGHKRCFELQSFWAQDALPADAVAPDGHVLYPVLYLSMANQQR